MSDFHTLLVTDFFIADDDENIYYAENTSSFEDTTKLMDRLREENICKGYTLCAVIDA
jgi:hypothetical protein